MRTTNALQLILAGFSLFGVALATPRASAADEAKPGDGPKITYADQVQPIFREHCLICHNQNEKKGGLALDSYAAAMEGGSSGEVVFAGDLESSRLWALVNRDEQPYMPPNQNRIADGKLDLIKQWIEGGALENTGSKAAVKKKTSLALSGPVTTGRPENPAMPEGLWKQPVVVSSHPGAVTALASSPWSPVVAVGGEKQVALYHSDNGRLLGVLPFPEGVPYVIRFSRDGALLLAAGGRGAHSGCAVLFDVKTGRRVTKVGDELDAVLAADVSPDHGMIALSGPLRLIRIYATDSGERLYEIKKHTDWVLAIEFSPDGVLLATADRANGLFVWEADTARQYLDLRGHTGAVTDVAWRPDSNVLASCSLDGSVKLWEMTEGKTVKSWAAHGGGAQCVEYTHDGRLATAGRDKTAKLWDGDGKQLLQFPGFPEPALEVTFTHDGRHVVAGDWSGQIHMWEAADGKPAADLARNPPTLAMLLEAAQAKFNAAQAAAQKAQAELAAVQQAAAEKAKAAQAAAEQAAASAAAAQQAEAARAAAQQAAGPDLDAKTAAAKAAADKAAADKAAAERLAAEKAELDKQVAAKQAPVEAAQRDCDAAKSELDQAAADKAAFEQAVAKSAAAVDQTKKQAEAAATRAKQAEDARLAAEQMVRQRVTAAKELEAKLPAAKAEYDQAVAAQKQAEAELAAKSQQAEQAKGEAATAQEAAEQAAADRKAFAEAYGL